MKKILLSLTLVFALVAPMSATATIKAGTSCKKAGQTSPIELESNKGLSNARGTLAMARTNVFNSATSEFFVNLVDNTFLDYRNAANPGYAVFGRVVQGMDVVDLIATKPTAVLNGFSDVPLEEVLVNLAVQVK